LGKPDHFSQGSRVGYSIQIRYRDELVIPNDSGYVPPTPTLPNYISLDAGDMKVITQIMIAAGIVDREILSSEDKKMCKPGMVPVYKFLMNEGYVVTAKEANAIAESLTAQDVLAPDFLKKVFPKMERFNQSHIDYIRELTGLWIPFNRVAASNNGYTIK
jgi:hypothetical protein